jgi:hypothetical protein
VIADLIAALLRGPDCPSALRLQLCGETLMRARYLAEDAGIAALGCVYIAVSATFDALLWLLGERGEGA